MNFSLRQLRAFIAVAESGQFTRAAQQLDLSQSSLSAAIRELEDSLNVRLFDRHTRMLQLTKAGAEFLPAVKRLVGELDDVVDATRDHARLKRGRVVLAAPGLQSALWLPEQIAIFTKKHPAIQVQLHDVPEHMVKGLVQSGAADIGLATSPQLSDDLDGRLFDTDSFVVIIRHDNPLALKPALPWHDLDGADIIGLVPENPMRRMLDDALATHGIRLRYTYEVAQPLTLVGLVRAGLGIAPVTSYMRPLVNWMGLALRPLRDPPISRDMMLITARDRSLTPAAQQFYQYLWRQDKKRMGTRIAVS